MTTEQASALTPSKAALRIDSCAECASDCLQACFNDAIAALPQRGVELVPFRCAGCGARIPACDLGHIRLADGVASFI